MTLYNLRYKVCLSLLASLAIVIHTLEASLPTPFPWLKFGLANIITLSTIVLFGLRAGLTITILRVFIGTLLTGTFLTPSFFLAFSGGIASTLVLAITYKYLGRTFSIIGISVIGAYTHTIVQVLVAYLIIIKHFQVFLMLPLFLIFSMMAGLLCGLGAEFVLRNLAEAPYILKIKNTQKA